MRSKITKKICLGLAAMACAAWTGLPAYGQTVVFSDDFESGTIDPAKWRADNRPFESGTSDIQPIVAGGLLEFSGTVTQEWWPGAALATVPTFSASLETNLVITVDRFAEYGTGTASRSALWITDAARNNFVLFADVRAEGGWRYNRKIGLNGDVPNGSGNDIAAFNSVTFDDGGYHQMKVIANGRTVKLYLDDILGAEVDFPFTDGIVVELGSYARANNDYAYTQFDNFQVAEVGAVSFAQDSVRVHPGTTSSDIAVRIPAGSNATQPVEVQVISSAPEIATPVGAVGGSLTLTFPAGGSTSQNFKVQGIKSGSAIFTFDSAHGLLTANELTVDVPFPIGTIFEDTFSTALDLTRWEINPVGFEAGQGLFDIVTEDGQLSISGTVTENYWAGTSIRTLDSYTASRDLQMVLEVDRTSLERTGTAARSGIYITSSDRSQYVAFQQNHGENGWTVNVNPGNPTGGGTTQDVLNGANDLGNHRLKLVANGETVTVYLDDVEGGTYPFPVSTGIHFEIGAYGRALDDTVTAKFDNVRISGLLPCTQVTPTDVTTELGLNSGTFDVTIPRLLNETDPATVTITSRDPSVAVPTGATGGTLKLTYAAAASNIQSVGVTTVGAGLTTFDVVDDQGGCVIGSVAITVTPALLDLVEDDFTSTSLNPTLWRLSDQPFETGVVSDDSTATQTGGQVNFHVTPGTSDWWPGLSYATVDAFSASAEEPVIFEVDRVSHVGVGASQRTGVWVTDENRQNYVFFSFDDNNMGWQYNRRINQAGDNPTAAGANIPAFDTPEFNHGNNVRIKVVANGSTAKLYLDGVLGAEVPFPVSNGIHFEFGAYTRSFLDVIDASFDNASVRGPMPCIRTDIKSVSLAQGDANPEVTVIIPRLLNASKQVTVTVTSSNPSVATPVGGSNGALTLTFAAGGASEQTFAVQRNGAGLARFTLSNSEGLCAANEVAVTSFSVAQELLSDTFGAGALDPAKWVEDSAPFETGAVDGSLNLSGGQLEITASATGNYWGGFGVTTVESFYAGPSDLLTLDVDRTYLADNGSTGARSSIWILDSTGENWVFFSDLSESGLGWTYNRKINQAGDVITGGGVDMAALNGETFDDRGLHRVKLVANGSTVKFYVDDVLGAEVAFPVSNGIRFRLGAYARAEFDLVSAGFDNAVITGSAAPQAIDNIDIARSGSQITLSWDGPGTLETTTDLGGTWSVVEDAESPYSTEATGTRFYRLSDQ